MPRNNDIVWLLAFPLSITKHLDVELQTFLPIDETQNTYINILNKDYTMYTWTYTLLDIISDAIGNHSFIFTRRFIGGDLC